MNYLDLQAIRKLLVDLRFIQAAALVAVGLHDVKMANDYMKRIKLAEKSIDDELGRLREIKADGAEIVQ